jgi:hypothetical protein
MPEEKQSPFLRKIMNERSDLPEENAPYTSERQLTAQAFNLQAEKRDGRHSEGFPWSHYAGCKWSDEGKHERLVILFGSRALEIEGHNLRDLVDEIREGKLNGVKEMVTSQAALKEANADEAPIINNISMYPDFEEILKEIKGEPEHDAGFARKVRGR